MPGVSTYVVDPNLKQPWQQLTVSGEHCQKTFPSVTHYIYGNKNWDLIIYSGDTGVYAPIPFVNPVTGETITIFNRLNPDTPESLLISNHG